MGISSHEHLALRKSAFNHVAKETEILPYNSSFTDSKRCHPLKKRASPTALFAVFISDFRRIFLEAFPFENFEWVIYKACKSEANYLFVYEMDKCQVLKCVQSLKISKMDFDPFSEIAQTFKSSLIPSGALKVYPKCKTLIKDLKDICDRFELPTNKNYLSKVTNSLSYLSRKEDSLCSSFSKLHFGFHDSALLTSEKDVKSNVTNRVPDEYNEKITDVPRSLMFAVLGWSGSNPNISIEVYDSISQKWFYLRQKNFIRRAYHGVVAIGVLIYVIGGYDGRYCCNTTFCFDVEERHWSQKPRMHNTRCYVTTVGHQGMVYAIGGFDGDDRLRSCERFNPRTRRWRYLESMNIRRSDGSGTVHQGKIYVCGGYNGVHILSSAEMYDIQSNQWTLIPHLPGPRSGQSMVSHRGSLYVIGGFDGFSRLQTVMRYDDEENCWIDDFPIHSPRSNFAAVVMADQLYVIGGYNGETTISEVEKFDSKTHKWEKIQNLKCHRSALGACVFDDSATYSICSLPDGVNVRRRNVEQASP